MLLILLSFSHSVIQLVSLDIGWIISKMLSLDLSFEELDITSRKLILGYVFVVCRWDSAHKMVWSGWNRKCFSDGFARAKSRRSIRLLWEEILTKDGFAVG